jgi:glutamate/tyrosine decarboxylase-like PLP-dependent enzyme
VVLGAGDDGEVFRNDEVVDRATKACVDYALQRLRLDPVPLDHALKPEELAARAGQTITPQGADPEQVMALFDDVLAAACISTDHDRYFAFIPAAPTKVSLIFDLVVGASGINASSWLEASGAIYAENQALRWLADLAGLPPSAGGCFVSGGSAGNLSALVAARETHRRSRSVLPGRVRIVVSDQAHSSVGSTLRIMDAAPLVVPTDDDGRLTGAAVAAALDADPDPGSVVAVVATAGTTNAGIVDDLAGVGAVARERGIWFHVDGAYGGAALAAPSARWRFAGIEQADSMVVDPHKWLFAPIDCCGLLYREPELARLVHTQHASYLDAIHDDGGDPVGEWNPSDYAYHLTRRARGLPFWFSLAVHGTDAYAAAVEHVLATTAAAAELIAADERLELVREPELSVLLFRRLGWEPADYWRWGQRLLDEQVALVLPSHWQDETVARIVLLNPRSELADVAAVLETMG